MAHRNVEPLISTSNSALKALNEWRWASELLKQLEEQLQAPDALTLAAALAAFAKGAPFKALRPLHKQLKSLLGDHSGCDATFLQAAGRAQRWQQALRTFQDAGKGEKLPTIAGRSQKQTKQSKRMRNNH